MSSPMDDQLTKLKENALKEDQLPLMSAESEETGPGTDPQ